MLDQFGTRWAAVLAALAGLLRWTVASGTTSALALSLIQPLHGLTFALLHLACMCASAWRWSRLRCRKGNHWPGCRRCSETGDVTDAGRLGEPAVPRTLTCTPKTTLTISARPSRPIFR
ncbi:hypothetical protein [Bradyrhizobium diazoefficiens]|uniref:hypothetical protein n=1 Tax=Bradyrhizobium diazoefficiens TaxID=1355477 RepID=UPI0034E4935E